MSRTHGIKEMCVFWGWHTQSKDILKCKDIVVKFSSSRIVPYAGVREMGQAKQMGKVIPDY